MLAANAVGIRGWQPFHGQQVVSCERPTVLLAASRRSPKSNMSKNDSQSMTNFRRDSSGRGQDESEAGEPTAAQHQRPGERAAENDLGVNAWRGFQVTLHAIH